MNAGTYFCTDLTIRTVAKTPDGWLYEQRPNLISWFYEDGQSAWNHERRLVKNPAKMGGMVLNSIPLSQSTWDRLYSITLELSKTASTD